jgi:hypothetical protein
MSIANPFSSEILLPPQVAGAAATEIDLTSAAVKAVYVISGKCQVVEWGVVITTTFVTFTVKPVIALRRKPLITGASATIQSLTLGVSNTTLRKYTNNPDAVASGGPGTVTVGPSIGGHTSALTADTDLSAGVVVLADTKSMPSVVLSPGDLLIVEVTTAGTVGSGKCVAFARLEPVQDPYTTAFVQYDAIP